MKAAQGGHIMMMIMEVARYFDGSAGKNPTQFSLFDLNSSNSPLLDKMTLYLQSAH